MNIAKRERIYAEALAQSTTSWVLFNQKFKSETVFRFDFITVTDGT